VGVCGNQVPAHTPRQSCGTWLRAFFPVRKQHTKQVKPGEGLRSQKHYTDRELRRRRIAAACSRNYDPLFERYWDMVPQWVSPLDGVHLWECEGTRFPHTPLWSGVYGFFDFVEKTIHPTRMGWHAPACGSSPLASRSLQREHHTEVVLPHSIIASPGISMTARLHSPERPSNHARQPTCYHHYPKL